MKVKELIESLSNCPPENEVLVPIDQNGKTTGYIIRSVAGDDNNPDMVFLITNFKVEPPKFVDKDVLPIR